MTYNRVVLLKKVSCSICRKKLIDGTSATAVTKSNKVKAYLCEDAKCLEKYKEGKEK